MNIEHLAYNVSEPAKMADWYVKNLNMRIVKAYDTPVPTRFIADIQGMMVELYHHATQEVLPFAKLNPLVAHLAFAPENVKAAQDKLVQAGATVATAAMVTPAGDEFAMLRDPFGFSIQLVKRKTPLR